MFLRYSVPTLKIIHLGTRDCIILRVVLVRGSGAERPSKSPPQANFFRVLDDVALENAIFLKDHVYRRKIPENFQDFLRIVKEFLNIPTKSYGSLRILKTHLYSKNSYGFR